MTITSLLGRTTCRIAFDQEEFRFGGVALLTISKFDGQRGDVHHALSTRKLTRLAHCLACGRDLDNLLDIRFTLALIYPHPLGPLFLPPTLQRLKPSHNNQLIFGKTANTP